MGISRKVSMLVLLLNAIDDAFSFLFEAEASPLLA